MFLMYLPFSVDAQIINTGDFSISENTIVCYFSDFKNESGGNLINDGELHLYGNWTNNGDVSFSNNTGITRFVSDSVQTIRGDETSNFYDLLFDNTSSEAPFLLEGHVSVENEVYFDNGIVNNSDDKGFFTFQENATHENTSDNSFVNGYVSKIGGDDFSFPVGDNSFYRSSISFC